VIENERRTPDWTTIALILVVIAVLAVVALLVFGQETEQILSTVSGSV
jgi:hypothetical protein